jgi:uncharacterized membrane protein
MSETIVPGTAGPAGVPPPGAASGSAGPAVDPGLVNYTHAIYALHALAVLIGLTSPATIVGSFVFGLPSIIAVIMNYARRSEVQGTWLESHFRWQIRTFWFALLWMALALVISTPLVLLLGLGVLTFMIAAAAVGLWVIYRVVRGWLALREARELVF